MCIPGGIPSACVCNHTIEMLVSIKPALVFQETDSTWPYVYALNFKQMLTQSVWGTVREKSDFWFFEIIRLLQRFSTTFKRHVMLNNFCKTYITFEVDALAVLGFSSVSIWSNSDQISFFVNRLVVFTWESIVNWNLTKMWCTYFSAYTAMTYVFV